jgi:hypothetical protein
MRLHAVDVAGDVPLPALCRCQPSPPAHPHPDACPHLHAGHGLSQGYSAAPEAPPASPRAQDALIASFLHGDASSPLPHRTLAELAAAERDPAAETAQATDKPAAGTATGASLLSAASLTVENFTTRAPTAADFDRLRRTLPPQLPDHYHPIDDQYTRSRACDRALALAMACTRIRPDTHDRSLSVDGALPWSDFNGSMEANTSSPTEDDVPAPPPLTETAAPEVSLAHVSPSIGFVAHSELEYVKKAVFWGCHPALLAKVRGGLRSSMWTSDICNFEQFNTHMNETYAQMVSWQRQGKSHTEFKLDYTKFH